MALEYCESFDDGLTPAQRGWLIEGLAYTGSGGRSGSCLKFETHDGSGYPSVATRVFSAAATTVSVGFAVKYPVGATGDAALMWLGTNGSSHNAGPMLWVHGGGSVDVGRRIYGWRDYTGYEPQTLATGVTFLPGGTWKYVEMTTVHSGTVGTITVRVDENVVYAGTGLDTRSFSPTDSTGYIGLGISGLNYANAGYRSASPWLVEDLVVQTGTTSLLGDVLVTTVYPDGSGVSSQLLGSDGDRIGNYALVNEATLDSTTYVMNEPGTTHRDSYTLQNIGGGSVLGLQVTTLVEGTDPAQPTVPVTPEVTTGGTRYQLTPGTVTGSGSIVRALKLNPVTGLAWTQAEIAALEVGVTL